MTQKKKEGDIWLKTRQDTPGIGKVIHLNNAGAALMPTSVLEVYQRHLILEADIGGYEAADIAKESLAAVYTELAALINCQETELALLDSATRAWAMAFYSIPFQSGDRILTCQSEYASNYIAFLQVARRYGVSIDVVPNDDFGALSLDHLRQMMDERVKLVAVTHVPSNGGLINPVEEIGAIVGIYDCFYLVDACQSVGQLDVDVARIGCDFLSATGRKYLRGPRGTGFLYVSHRALGSIEPPMLDLHSATWTAPDRMHIRPDARCFEMWEFNVAARLAFGEAVRYARMLGINAIEERVQKLANDLRNAMAFLSGIRLHDLGRRKCGIVSFTMDGYDCVSLVELLKKKKINVSVSPASHTFLDMKQRNLGEIVRASVHYYNNQAELDMFTQALQELRPLRTSSLT